MKILARRVLFVGAVIGAWSSGCGGSDSNIGLSASSSSSSSGRGGAGGEGTGGAGTGGAGTGGMGTGGAGGSAPCVDGATKPCFTGDPITLGVGECVEGSQTCAAGVFGACTGEVVATKEACNGLDDDCNGTTDEGFADITCGVGACQNVVAGCTGGTPGVCVPLSAGPEVCDGVDNNCDGAIDEGCPCSAGATQACYTGPASTKGVGACKDGTQACMNGAWGACVGDTTPAPEACDSVDNDCNGQVDEGFAAIICGLGACQASAPGCVNGAPGSCVPLPPSAEKCDGLDNNCDGVTDESCQCQDGQMQPCYTGPAGTQGVGACKAGSQTCVGGAWAICVGDVKPAAEVCDAVDNDCNGAADDGNPGGGAVCSTGMPGVCAAGTTACTGGAVVCVQNVMSSAEACDGKDNDCDGIADNGNPGGGLACMTGLQGVCSAGTTACSGGAIACNQDVMASAETCDGKDNNCDGASDEGNPGGGLACMTGLQGVCSAGTTACSGGAIACNQNVMSSAEICDGQDNNCDGSTDEGNPGGGAACSTGLQGVCAAGTMKCVGGALTCVANVAASPELCDNLDNDCDGAVDNGNPGGGQSCGASLGGCTTQTACVAGAIVCRGTFVAPAPLGAPGNPGTQAAPLSTITAAQANAAIIGGGADVCVCDPATAGPSTFSEDITMVEGTSVLGGYNCAGWARAIATYVTVIQDTTVTGVKFPAGITSVTALDGMSVVGMAANPGTSAAITVTDASPSLTDLIVTSGIASTAYALNVTKSGLLAASPVVKNGSYTATATGNGTQFAVNLVGASPSFNATNMSGGGAAGGAAPMNSAGLRCSDCAGTTITGGAINGGLATTVVAGIWATGSVNGLTITGANAVGGQITQAAGTGWGMRFEACNGSPSINTVNTLGGSGQTGSRIGIEATGAMCSPAVSAGQVRGCETGTNCTGMSCSTNAVCGATNASIAAASGQSMGTAYGVRCLTGGCGKFTGNTITAGMLGGNVATVGMGIDVVGTSPAFDDNDIAAPFCQAVAVGATLYGAHFSNSASLATNNVIRDQFCTGVEDVVRYDKILSPNISGPTIHSNTISYTTSNGSGARRGIAIAAPAGAVVPASGVVRNNIIRNAGLAGLNAGVFEADASSDLLTFENNDIWAPGGALYIDEGANPLLLPAINMLLGAAANISADPLLNATYHIPAGSPCLDKGTATGAPALDFDGDARPQGIGYDIGADEFK